MASLETDVLFDLIRSKRECLERLQMMGQRQMELIEADQMTALLDLLAYKQRTLGDLQKIERNLNPFRGQSPETRQWRSEEARRRCAEELNTCETLLAGIIERERASEQAMISRRDRAAAQLQGMHRASQARASYAGPAACSISQIDLCSDAS
ncbi:MAG: hypothetical protein U1E05_12775 [Patescibacteria group bacterium]|nr:hypothetical protein [Patescibacteria group bacterium]